MSSFNYDRYDRRQNSSSRRSTLGYWVPLTLTVVVATAGLAAWVWSAREDQDETSSDDDLSYGEDGHGGKSYGKAPIGPHGSRDGTQSGVRDDETDLYSRAQGIIRRTPSPQQLFDSVSKKTAAGLAAAGAAAGAALASIREEDRDDYGDHSRWSEEAAIRRNVEAQSAQSAAAVDTQTRSFTAALKNPPTATGKRKTVVLVVSAESLMDSAHEDDGSYRSENAVSSGLSSIDALLTCPDHPLPPPRHRYCPHQALRARLLAVAQVAPPVPHRFVFARRLVLGHLHAGSYPRRGTAVH